MKLVPKHMLNFHSNMIQRTRVTQRLERC